MRVELRAIDLAKHYFKERGYSVDHVSGKKGHGGYDLLICKGKKKVKIEVKGCTREWQIPDLFVTEFDEEKGLTADFLCVVYFIEKRKPSLCLIPREVIKPCDVTPKKAYRISSRIKKRSILEPYQRPL